MKAALVILATLLLGATTAAAQSGAIKPRTTRDAKTMSADEVEHYFAPYAAETRECYLRHATRGGDLRLDIIIHRDGSVFRLWTDTSRADARAAKRIEACVQRLAKRWHFPPRLGFTRAIVPFHFQKTTAPNAGPLRSCWRARGCSVRR